MIDLLFLIFIAVICYLLGYWLLKMLGYNPEGRAELLLYSLSLGLGVVSVSVLCLGLAGMLYKGVIIGFLFVIALAMLLTKPKEAFRKLLIKSKAKHDVPSWLNALLIITALYMLYQLANCMTPVINGDSIAWYLSVPKQFIADHSVLSHQLSEDYTSSNLPLNLFMLSAMGLLLKSEILSQLILGWLMSVLIFLAVYVSIKQYTHKHKAFLSAALFYMMPTMAWLIFSAKMDLGYTMFELCFWSLFIKWLKTSDKKTLFISAIFLGFAIGSKYHSLIALTVVALAIFVRQMVSKEHIWNVVKTITVFSLISLFIGSPSYLKNFYLTGDPFYPFLLGSGVVDGEGFNIYNSLFDLPRFGYNLIFGKEFFAKSLYWADRPLGFLPLVLVPLASLKNIRANWPVIATLAAYSFVMCCLVMLSVWPFPRHILPAVALMVALFAISSNDIFASPKFEYIGWLIVMLMMLQTIPNLSLKTAGNKLRYLAGNLSKQQYLSREVFDKPLSTHMNSMMLSYVSTLPRTARILALDFGNGFYVDRPFLKKGYVYDETEVDKFIDDCKKDRFTHIYYSDTGLSWFVNNPKLSASFAVLKHEKAFLRSVYTSGDQHLFTIVYPQDNSTE